MDFNAQQPNIIPEGQQNGQPAQPIGPQNINPQQSQGFAPQGQQIPLTGYIPPGQQGQPAGFNPTSQPGNTGQAPYQNQYTGAFYQPATPPPPQYNKANPTLARDIIMSIIVFIICNRITGAVSLILVMMGDDAYKKGDYGKYEEDRKIARILRIIGCVLFVIGLFLAMLYLILTFVLGFGIRMH